MSTKKLVYDISELIPQRSPVVMVDAFYGFEGDVSQCGLTVADDTFLCTDGRLDECGVVEHVAQAAALRVGYLCLSESRPVPIGFIGSVNKLTIHSLPIAGEQIRSRIKVVQEVMNISMIEAVVETSGGRAIADCRMKIFLKQDG